MKKIQTDTDSNAAVTRDTTAEETVLKTDSDSDSRRTEVVRTELRNNEEHCNGRLKQNTNPRSKTS